MFKGSVQTCRAREAADRRVYQWMTYSGGPVTVHVRR